MSINNSIESSKCIEVVVSVDIYHDVNHGHGPLNQEQITALKTLKACIQVVLSHNSSPFYSAWKTKEGDLCCYQIHCGATGDNQVAMKWIKDYWGQNETNYGSKDLIKEGAFTSFDLPMPSITLAIEKLKKVLPGFIIYCNMLEVRVNHGRRPIHPYGDDYQKFLDALEKALDFLPKFAIINPTTANHGKPGKERRVNMIPSLIGHAAE